ncbi:MAG: RagB/SusD family nutrient uptake outer membrane protein [Tannerella sp.]|jgi:tetratricopeptide (TPR) repeat protein|nr:RagB/SusD family nutrient uptake outer membrane protein [Tannerella sp.]
MKKINHIFQILFLFALCGCSGDFLDKSDPMKLNSGSFYQTETQFEQAASGVYSQLQEYVSNAWQCSEMITDNTTVHFNTEDRGQAPGLEAIEYWQINPNTLEQIGPYNLYNGLYSYLANINIVLSKLQNATISEASKTGFEGQMRFMRAYYYFQLVQFFGDVIIVTEPITNPDGAWQYERSSVSEVYALIDGDVKFAVDALPVTPGKVGLPTKGAALTLQGRTLLARRQYAEAIAAFRQVTQSGYQLLPDYADVFDPVKKNHAESIMDVQFQGNNDLGEYSGFLYTFYPRESYGAVIPFPGRNGGGWNIPTLEIIRSYEEGDLRKEVSLKEGYTNNDGEWTPVPYINKYNHPHSIEGRPDDNWPLMRYAEVLLSLAEAINETDGPTAEAYGYLNQIRQRAGLSPVSGLTKEAFREKVLHDRRIELAFENHRWFDLKRTMTQTELAAFMSAYGKYEMANPTTPTRASMAFSSGDFEFEPYETFLPIPSRELRLNPAVKQTEGYR